jgi:hypothetical protein
MHRSSALRHHAAGVRDSGPAVVGGRSVLPQPHQPWLQCPTMAADSRMMPDPARSDPAQCKRSQQGRHRDRGTRSGRWGTLNRLGGAPGGGRRLLVPGCGNRPEHFQSFLRTLARAAVAGLSGALAVGAISLGVWVTVINDSVQSARMVALTTVYSLSVAIILSAVTTTARAIRRWRGDSSGRLIASHGKRCQAHARGPVLKGRPVVIGDIPLEPPGFQPRKELLAELYAPGIGGRVSIIHAVTGMRGAGKTHLAAGYVRTRLVIPRYKIYFTCASN